MSIGRRIAIKFDFLIFKKFKLIKFKIIIKVRGWMDGWMDGVKPVLKDCLAQYKNLLEDKFVIVELGRSQTFLINHSFHTTDEG